MFQAQFFGDVLEFSAAQVFIQDALLAARRKSPALKSVRSTQIKAAVAFFVPGVHPHICHKQIQQAVVVKVKEHRARGMAGGAEVKAGFQRDVFESSLSEVLEQEIPHPDRGDKQVRQTVIVHVGE